MPRRKNDFLDDLVVFRIFHPGAITADTTTKEFRTGNRPMRLESVKYVNPTGLVQDAANYFTIKLQAAGGAVLASRDTLTGSGGTLPPNAFVDLNLAANPVLPANTDLELFLDETGVATLPAGTLVVTGRLL